MAKELKIYSLLRHSEMLKTLAFDAFDALPPIVPTPDGYGPPYCRLQEHDNPI